ncbi:COX15/CtaA family protein [Coraliomargarita sp. SDUM461003]|uniref:COX15/CtaA family protein n=1 Tax=Thalassobacterium maritimum TaxID=3041265 RepID=A0ABU1AUJ1_9BACT|nr:COX15/CtaA family protein [Coraliomargarita sp. SDUM461003]MDQ8207803.1 COX15/CtaA family protein [Coraliomargarita sp. SDUM461003]
MPALTQQRTDGYKPFLFLFCLFALAWITLLLFAGGMTTSIQAGMAFLDWPLSNGSINPDGWLSESDKMAEHSHRLLGMKIGLLSLGLLLWTYLRESRKWVRTLARILVWVVILQGVLGGSRVRFDQLNIMSDHNMLAQSFAVMHACGAMVVLGLLVALTLANTRRWIEGRAGLDVVLPVGVKRWGIAATITLFLQILVGAIMRHAGAGLAIATFPLASSNSLIPAYWNFGVSIHFAHRVGAVIVTAVLLIFLGKVWGSPAAKRALGYGALVLALILGLQIFLGALTIWTVKNPYAATLHQLVGAFLLASTWGLTFLAHHSGRATNSPHNN